MYLFFDTETADKPRNWKAPASDLDNWPRQIQIGWICCDRTERATGSGEYLIRPEGFTIAQGAMAVHGITTERALQEGVELEPVLEEFTRFARKAQVLVAHNMDFDQKVLQAEFLRTGMVFPVAEKTWRCTMKESTRFCRLPGPYGYKWPKLDELYQILFDEPCEEAHSALADAEACMRSFFELKEMGVIR
jgi:DNA polymerase III subunit epsilon